MDIRQLRYFVTVVDERNFTRAAKRLHMAQPPLSRQIRQLEAEVGGELIDRTARPLRLTAVGHLVYEQAVQVLGRVNDMSEMVKRAVVAERRRFVIGFVSSIMYARLPALVREFRSAVGEVDLSLVEMVTLEQIHALKDGRIDVGFGRIRFEDDAVRRIVLREERLIAALPATHALARDPGAVSLNALAKEPLILYPRQPRPSYADQVIGLFRDLGLEPRISHEARELQIAVGLVAAEEGISIVPGSVRKFRVEGVTYRNLADPATSPIIMSHRVSDHSPELRRMAGVIGRMHRKWGYAVPDGIKRLAESMAGD